MTQSSSITQSIIAFAGRTLATLPLVVMRTVINMGSAPPAYKHWHRDVGGEGWRGLWVGEDFGVREVNEIEAEMRDGGADLVMIYVHGGAFRVGHAKMFLEEHVKWINNLQKDYNGIKLRILSVEYGLSPEHKYPSAILEIVEAYRYVLETLSIPASKVIIAGDSSGGNLILATLYHLFKTSSSLPRPSSIFCISPLLTFDITAPSITYNAYLDVVPTSLLKAALHDYLPLDGSVKATDPHISPLLVPTVQWLPQRMCIAAGGREILRDDIVQFAERVQAEAQETECVLVEAKEAMHDWVLSPWMVTNEETRDSLFGVIMGWLAGAAEGRKE